jgi:hypothetical protein
LRRAFSPPEFAKKRQTDAPIAGGLVFHRRAIGRVGKYLDLVARLREPAGNNIDPVPTEDDDLVAVDEHAIDRSPQSCPGSEPKKFEPAAVKMNHTGHAAISRERCDNDLSIGTALQ